MQLKAIDPFQKNLPTLPLLVKVGEELYETDCLPGVVAAVVGREYLDVRTAKAAWNMRVNAARQIAAFQGGFGIPVIVRDEKSLLADNRVCPPDEQEEMDEIDWQDCAPLVIWAHPDRAFVISLMEADMIQVGEHSDSYILRYGPPWAGINSQNCGACQYFKLDQCGVYGSKKAEDAGTQCPAFAPRQAKKSKPKKASDVKYIGLDGTVPLAEAAYIMDRKALAEIDALADYSKWWEE